MLKQTVSTCATLRPVPLCCSSIAPPDVLQPHKSISRRANAIDKQQVAARCTTWPAGTCSLTICSRQSVVAASASVETSSTEMGSISALHDLVSQLKVEEEQVRARREALELQLMRLQRAQATAAQAPVAPTPDANNGISTNSMQAAGAYSATHGTAPGGASGAPVAPIKKRMLKPKSKRMAAVAAAAGLLRVSNGNGSQALPQTEPGMLGRPSPEPDSRSSMQPSSLGFMAETADYLSLLADMQQPAGSPEGGRSASCSPEQTCVIPKPIFIVSDCTGESAARTVRAALNQFELCFGTTAPATLVVFRFVEDEEKVYRIIETAAREDALVVYTLVRPASLKAVQTACKLMNVRNVDLWSTLLDGMEAHLEATRSGVPLSADAPRRPVLTNDYFKMIEAVEYTRKMDDGANPKEWKNADLLILGVSRCGKTPLSIFLGQRGYKVANLPLVPGMALPKELYEIDQTRIVGLTIDANVLLSIRRNRIGMMGVKDFGVPIDYAVIQKVLSELDWARQLYASNPQWPVLDVTLRGVEETAARILKILNDKRGDASPQWVEELYGKMRGPPSTQPFRPPTLRLSPLTEQAYIGGEQYLVEGLY